MSDDDSGIQAASRRLYEKINHASWCISMGVGSTDDGRPAIHVYTRTRGDERRIREQLPEWEGFPVVVRFSGPMRLC